MYAPDYGIEQDAGFDILVPAEDKHNDYPCLAYRVFFQVDPFLYSQCEVYNLMSKVKVTVVRYHSS